MSKCVFRTDLRQHPVGEPLAGVDPTELFYRPTASTILECVQRLLAPNEICLGNSDLREIRQGVRIVGFVRIVDVEARCERSAS